MKIYGLATIRNATEIGYPFIEAFLSVYPMVDEFVVIDGGSGDGTHIFLSILNRNYPKFIILNRRDVGHQDYECIDNGLQFVLDEIIPQKSWVVHSQADELFHERDVNTLIAMMHWADWKGYNSIRQRRLDYGWLNQPPDGYEYRIIRLFKNDRIISKCGGDDFRTKGLPTPRIGYTSHNIPPELDSNIPFYHFPMLYPYLQKAKLERHLKHLSVGAKDRERVYKSIMEQTTDLQYPKFLSHVREELPYLIKEVPIDHYKVREGLFNASLLSKATGLKYE